MDNQVKLVEKYYAFNDTIKLVDDFSYIISKSRKIIYEVIRVKSSTPIFFEQHLDRLINSVKLLGFTQPDKNVIEKIISDLLRYNPITENNIRISLIYSSPKSFDLLVYYTPSSYPTDSQRNNGVSVKTLCANRNNPNAKVENFTLRQKADIIINESGCYEVLLIDKNGYIAEGSRSNVFFIKDYKLFTSPLEMVLGGITRQIVISLAKSLGISLIEEIIPADKLGRFDGSFLTGTSPGLLPIAFIDDNKYAVNFPLLNSLIDAYNKAVTMDMAKFKRV